MEEVAYALLSELKSGPKKRKKLTGIDLKGWSEGEMTQVLSHLEDAGLVEGEDELELTKKGKFHWKRIHRKKQGFV